MSFKNKLNSVILIFCLVFLIFSATVLAGNPEFVLIYVVQEGETLYDIARDYNIPLQRLIAENNLEDNLMVDLGQEIVIPFDEQQETYSPETKFSAEILTGNHGQDDDFLRLNTGDKYAVRVNDEQVLPEVDYSEEELIYYHIRSGDTLYDLAMDFNTSTGVIMALNDLENNIVRPGEIIRVPITNLSQHEVLSRTISDYELDLLARVIHAEARGEPRLGQIAVGAVVINRMLSPYFPDTIEGVVYQSGQFTAVYDGQINLPPNSQAYDAARRALEGYDPTQGALYYYNPEIATNRAWFENTRETIITIGEHDFAR